MTDQSVHLPQEIIKEILSRLGVKPLLILRCVSKSWRSLIASERFIRTQFQISRKKTSLAHHKVIFHCESGVTKQCSLQSLLNEPYIDPHLMDSPTNNHLQISRVVGCCNGLLCVFIFPRTLLLWNPATRISIQLPERDFGNGILVKYGFGWDEKSGAYKVFAVVYDHEHEHMIGKVYSMNSNSWITVESGAFLPYGSVGQFVCGKIHWFNKNEHYIESFDLESQEFGRIELSFDPDYWLDLMFGEVGGCLCVCDHYPNQSRLYIDIWVMKEYGLKESWFKLLTIPCVQLKLPTDHHFYKFYQVNIEGADTEILLRCGDRFLVYYSKDIEFSAHRTMEGLREYDDAQVYVESLVSPASGQEC